MRAGYMHATMHDTYLHGGMPVTCFGVLVVSFKFVDALTPPVASFPFP